MLLHLRALVRLFTVSMLQIAPGRAACCKKIKRKELSRQYEKDKYFLLPSNEMLLFKMFTKEEDFFGKYTLLAYPISEDVE
jgi:hypothetical protein